ncbi:hypothetical protein C1645_839760 [Glomus cerebriforme]|uniref:Uncharacterized protein n=1 Tax=Glomus cerebriforme TaxID=658196 RepID=A0A397S796_9GLOM|nr:hypothetical protein C1645_839760 [Glomus cerebriforme]
MMEKIKLSLNLVSEFEIKVRIQSEFETSEFEIIIASEFETSEFKIIKSQSSCQSLKRQSLKLLKNLKRQSLKLLKSEFTLEFETSEFKMSEFEL